jgi:hypothetical protein
MRLSAQRSAEWLVAESRFRGTEMEPGEVVRSEMNTPLQETTWWHRRYQHIGLLGHMEVCRADDTMMCGGVVLGEVVTQVLGTLSPVN